MRIEEIDALISLVAPIYGVNSNGVIWFKEEASDEQKAAAESIMQEKIILLDSD